MSAVEQAEVRRWLVGLGLPLLITSVCIAGAIAVTPALIAGAVLLAPLAMTAIAYLGITSDTNGEASAAAQPVELPRRDDIQRRAA